MTDDPDKKTPPPHIAVLSLHPLFDTRICNHIKTLIESGYRVSYINWSLDTDGLDERVKDDIELIQRAENPVVGFNPWKYARLLWWFLKQSKKINADLYHLHDPLLMPLINPLGRSGRRCVFDAHEHYDKFPGIIGMFYRLCYRWCVSAADGVVGVSESTVPQISKQSSQSQPAVVVANYQNRADFEPYLKTADQTPTNKKDHDDPPVRVVYFGNLYSENRDVAGMIEVARLVLRQRKDVYFEFGGVLHGPDAQLNQIHIEALADRYRHRFLWFAKMPRDLVIARTATADIGLWILAPQSMNVTGANPNKVFEYLTAGVAMMATEGFVIAHQIRQAKAGVLLPVATLPQFWAQAIVALASDRTRLSQMKQASAELGKQFTWQQAAANYLDLYRQIGVM